MLTRKWEEGSLGSAFLYVLDFHVMCHPSLDEKCTYSLGAVKLAILSVGPFILVARGVHHLVTHMKNVMKQLCVHVVSFVAL